MQHANDINSVIERNIEDGVMAEGDAAQTHQDLVATPAHFRMRRRCLQLGIQVTDPGVGLRHAVFGNGAPDLADTLGGT